MKISVISICWNTKHDKITRFNNETEVERLYEHEKIQIENEILVSLFTICYIKFISKQ